MSDLRVVDRRMCGRDRPPYASGIKAQIQCWETPATIQAGLAIFARKANIAYGLQEMHNGVPANNSREGEAEAEAEAEADADAGRRSARVNLSSR